MSMCVCAFALLDIFSIHRVYFCIAVIRGEFSNTNKNKCNVMCVRVDGWMN